MKALKSHPRSERPRRISDRINLAKYTAGLVLALVGLIAARTSPAVTNVNLYPMTAAAIAIGALAGLAAGGAIGGLVGLAALLWLGKQTALALGVAVGGAIQGRLVGDLLDPGDLLCRRDHLLLHLQAVSQADLVHQRACHDR